MARKLVFASGAVIGLGMAMPAMGGITEAAISPPAFDRWVYPFSGTPGQEAAAPAFAAINEAQFDDRDSTVLLGFNVPSSLVPAGLPASDYRIISMSVQVTVQSDARWAYSGTPTPACSLFNPPGDGCTAPASWPMELFAVGYRGGLTPTTMIEAAPFVFGNPIGEGIRRMFPVVFASDDATGAIDVSNQVRDRVEARAMAVGNAAGIAPGQLVPAGTTLTFPIDLCTTGARRYLQQGLARGQVQLMISSLQPATGGPGGGGGAYPAFFTKESQLAVDSGWTPKLNFSVRVGRLADMNNDQGISIEDLLDFLLYFDQGDIKADVTDDCGVTIEDLLAYLQAFADG